MKNHFKKQHGFSMIELLIYISVISAATIIFTSFTADVVKRTARILNAKEVTQNSRLIAARISQEIKTAKSIDALAGDEITLTNFNNEQVTISYDAANNLVELTNPNGTIAITNNKIRVTALVFEQLTPEAVAFQMTVEQSNATAPKSLRYKLDFTTTVVPRPQLY